MKKKWIRNIAWGFLFVACWCVLYFGTQRMLFFIPDTWGEVDEYDGEVVTPGDAYYGRIVSLALVSLVFIILYHKSKKIRTYKKALKILGSQDKAILAELRPYYRESVALEVLLAEKGIFCDTGEICEEVVKVIGEDIDLVYYYMVDIDQIMLEMMPARLKEDYPSDVLDLRRNLLKRFLEKTRANEYLYIEGSEIDDEFYKVVLDKFYKRFKNYKMQSADFDMTEFEEFIKQHKMYV